MAVTFLEPGGDATFTGTITTNGGFWASLGGSGGTVSTDFVHGSHIKSLKYGVATGDTITAPTGLFASNQGRISIYIYLVTLPDATATLFAATSSGNRNVTLRLTSSGVLQLWNTQTAQIGTNGSTLSTGIWYRLCVAFTESSTSVNEFRLFKDGSLDISVTNASMTNATPNAFRIGNDSSNATLDFRSSDHYTDNSNSLTDTGDVWVTAKRPNANGTINNFNTQIGSGGSGYGTGHSPQVNERALSTTNGWSVVAIGATTEDYTIESSSTGDIDISTATFIDFMGWVYASALLSETAQIMVAGNGTNISLTSTNTMFTKALGSSTYPSGGNAIGIITDATATTVSLYECGIMVAYTPTVTSPSWSMALI